MQAIADQVYIEDQFPGVTLGAIALPHGLIQVDAPPSPEDGRSWRAALLNINGGVERILINLDAHPDRTLGVRAMDTTVIAHEKTAQTFRNRPNTFKAQGEETGADWESVVGLGSVRWAPPEISFSNHMEINWNEGFPLILEHHPGPSSGAIWVTLPANGIVFVGDLVLKNQPPFLASADLPQWLESLDQLLAPHYKNFIIVSGRGGVVSQAVVKSQRELLSKLHEKLENLIHKQAGVEATEGLIPSLLSSVKAPADRSRQYSQRISYGLRHYYTRYYNLSNSLESEEE